MRTIPILSPATTAVQEHVVLCRAYGDAQERCSRVMAQQQAEIAHLQAQVMRLRAAVMVRDTALSFALERSAVVERQPNAAPADPVPERKGLVARLRALQWLRPWGHQGAGTRYLVVGPRRSQLAAADLLAGQGGWLSHGVDWPG